MKTSYPKNGDTLRLDRDACVACGACFDVCPHAVFAMRDGKAEIADRGACMECGACALNCPATAIAVTAGVGCAQAIILGKLRGTAPTCGEAGCGGGTRGRGKQGACC